jgi:micrococcal nuclease
MPMAGPAQGAGRLGAMFNAPPIASRSPIFALSRLVSALCLVLLLCGAAVAPLGASAQEAASPQVYEARVTRVSDGDTVWVQPLSGGRYRKLRLDGLDAPEICQGGGTESRDSLAQRVLRQRVTVTERRLDEHGRGLATLDHGGTDVGGWMVSQGQAWSYRWRRSLGPYQAQETLARAQRRGLFAQADAELPRAFRQRHGPCERP